MTAASCTSRWTPPSPSSETCPPTSSRARASETSIQLVLTAHPTETTRRSVLLAHIRIQEQLVVLDDPRVSPAERRRPRSALQKR